MLGGFVDFGDVALLFGGVNQSDGGGKIFGIEGEGLFAEFVGLGVIFLGDVTAGVKLIAEKLEIALAEIGHEFIEQRDFFGAVGRGVNFGESFIFGSAGVDGDGAAHLRAGGGGGEKNRGESRAKWVRCGVRRSARRVIWASRIAGGSCVMDGMAAPPRCDGAHISPMNARAAIAIGRWLAGGGIDECVEFDGRCWAAACIFAGEKLR